MKLSCKVPLWGRGGAHQYKNKKKNHEDLYKVNNKTEEIIVYIIINLRIRQTGSVLVM